MPAQCPICVEFFEPEQEIAAVPCGHTFHRHCLAKWYQKANSCPQCRRVFTRPEVIPKLYFDQVNEDKEQKENVESMREQLQYMQTTVKTLQEQHCDLQYKYKSEMERSGHGDAAAIGFEDFSREKRPSGKYFMVRSQLSGLVLDISGGSRRSGTQVITWEVKVGGDNSNQLWFQDDENVCIRSKLAPNMCLTFNESSGRLEVCDAVTGGLFQQFQVMGERLCCGNRVLEVEGQQKEHRASLRLADWTGAANQKWELIYRDYFFVESLLHGKVLDAQGGWSCAGTRVITYDKKNKDNQIWYLDSDGILHSRLNGYVMDSSGGSVTLEPMEAGNPRQRWGIRRSHIINLVDLSLCLEIEDANKANSAHLRAAVYGDEQHKLWKVTLHE